MKHVAVSHKVPPELIEEYERERTVVQFEPGDFESQDFDPEQGFESVAAEAEYVLLESDLNREMWESEKMLEWLKSTQAIPRLGYPEDVAPLALFLSSRGADYITGQVIPVDGGYTTTAVWPFEP